MLAGGWLAARPKAAVADLAKQLHTDPGTAPVTARLLRLVHDALPQTAARTLRLLALAPAGLADPHTAAALTGCSVEAAHTTLDDFAAHGLLHSVGSALPQYRVPGCLHHELRRLAEDHERPAELQLARARMLERTVRLLQSCRAITETDSPESREKLAALPRPLRFPTPAPPPTGCACVALPLLAAARLAVADGELDTLARRLMSQLVRALVAHFGTRAAASDLYDIHNLVLDVAERRNLPRERAAALLNLGDLDARTGRTTEALARYRAALDAGREANDPYATGRAMESVGGAHLDLGDYDRAADWYGRALAERLARDERPGGRPALRPHRRRPHLRGPLRRGDAQLARGRRRAPQGRGRGRAGTGAQRTGPGAGVRGAAGGVAAHLPGGRGVGAARRGHPAPGRAAPAAGRLLRASRRPRVGRAAPEHGRAHAGGGGPEGDSEPEHGANACEIRTASAED